MRTGDADASASLLHQANGLGVTHHVNTAATRFVNFRVFALDGGAGNHQVARSRQLFCGVTDAHGDAFGLQCFGCRTGRHITAGNFRATALEHLCKPTHSASTDTNQPHAPTCEVGDFQVLQARAGALKQCAHRFILWIRDGISGGAPVSGASSCGRDVGEVNIVHVQDIGKPGRKSSLFWHDRRSFGTLVRRDGVGHPYNPGSHGGQHRHPRAGSLGR